MSLSLHLPPGTHLLEDVLQSRLVLAPQPNEDPNQPFVGVKCARCVLFSPFF